MKLGIMQPYFFPYLGHFALIAAVDEWIVFDITQYTRKSWINRNRVLHPDHGWQYISIPLRNSSIHIRISEAKVADSREQERYVLGKISHYKKHAPYYGQVCEIVRSSFAGVAHDSLVSLNVTGLRTVCEYLRLPFTYRLCSQLNIEFPDKLLPGTVGSLAFRKAFRGCLHQSGRRSRAVRSLGLCQGRCKSVVFGF